MIKIRFRGVRRASLNSLARLDDALELVGADQGIHLGHLLADIPAIALHQASGHDQPLGAPDLLILGHLQDGIHGLLLGGVDEAARVHHQHVGLVRVRSQLVTLGHELAHHHFAIHEVFGAPQADESDFQVCIQGKGCLPPLGYQLRRALQLSARQRRAC